MRPPPKKNLTQVGTIDTSQSYAVFKVADTGLGMAPDQIERVFQAYYSTKGDGGTGLACLLFQRSSRACAVPSA